MKILNIVNKDNLPDGPWKYEGDRYSWTDYNTGYHCLIVRHSLYGHLCGYVHVPKDHPLHNVHYDDSRIEGLDVHGGVTFSEPLPELNNLFCLGFDCAHYDDYSPIMAMEGFSSLHLQPLAGEPKNYKPVGYVIKECMRLVEQLVRIKNEKENL